MEDFKTLLKKLMVCENFYSEDEADRLIKKYPDIIIQGIMKGNFALRATVMAIGMKEDEEMD